MKTTLSKLVLPLLIMLSMSAMAQGRGLQIAPIGSSEFCSEKNGEYLNSTKTRNGSCMMIEGSVSTFETYPVNEVKILAKKSGSIAYSDASGKFEIEAIPGEKLVFFANGFEKQKSRISNAGGKLSVNLMLEQGTTNKELAVIHGHLTYQVVNDGKGPFAYANPNYAHYSSLRELLSGELINAVVSDHAIIKVYVRPNGGYQPGDVEDNVEAGFIVNGMRTNFIDDLNPQDIESVSFKRDLAAPGPFCRSTSNCVVEIRTR